MLYAYISLYQELFVGSTNGGLLPAGSTIDVVLAGTTLARTRFANTSFGDLGALPVGNRDLGDSHVFTVSGIDTDSFMFLFSCPSIRSAC